MIITIIIKIKNMKSGIMFLIMVIPFLQDPIKELPGGQIYVSENKIRDILLASSLVMLVIMPS